ncbi:Metabolite transport protein [Vulcanisaeta moutnovskia 768-28]|uniref:Metabolite transport protein n=1 Tax=Vulcanisaeta moutnovskia (strain 768-28) TaxID=985053 RepID=F0QYC2_VULM7|nr:MFS transporter [Vulcanisaeta moutnovskia]ADY01359.1 Metabolite transport protein [Vulcanisaeta moutnovskia 768-28]
MGTKTVKPSLGIMIALALASTAGLALEFYSFVIYGYAATLAFPKVFFPKLPLVLAIVIGYLTFAAGFPARIIGAFVFGHFGDKYGRSGAFIWDLIVTGVATILIGLLPGYTVLGYGAPILLTILRFFQGFGLGGEFGGATALLVEFAEAGSSRWREFWVGWANAGFSIGGLAGALALLIPNFATTGWRIAFILSAVIFIPALVARIIIRESPFMAPLLEKKLTASAPSISVFRRYWLPIILIAMWASFQQFDGYASLTYMVTFMKFLSYPIVLISLIIIIGRIYDLAGVFLNAVFGKFLKRRVAGFIMIAVTTAFSYLFTYSLIIRNIPLVLISELFLVLFGVGLMHAFAPVLASENFPTRYRYSGSGIAYQLSAIIGGMFTPSILTALIGKEVMTKWFYVPLFYFIYFIIATIALVLLRETKGIALAKLDEEDLSKGG